MWRTWSQRRLRAETADRLVAAVLLVWALFDVPWWWRHGAAIACALLATALGMGEVTSSHRDAAAAAARHAQDTERARLARELHDVVAHQLSAIAVQAGAARLAAAGHAGRLTWTG